jgi:hypothetical protein
VFGNAWRTALAESVALIVSVPVDVLIIVAFRRHAVVTLLAVAVWSGSGGPRASIIAAARLRTGNTGTLFWIGSRD